MNCLYDGSPGLGGFTTTSMAAWGLSERWFENVNDEQINDGQGGLCESNLQMDNEQTCQFVYKNSKKKKKKNQDSLWTLIHPKSNFNIEDRW